MWYVYVCNRGGQLYTGITTNLGHRMKQHKAELLCSEKFADKHGAAKKEREIKGWGREKKLALAKVLLSLFNWQMSQEQTPCESLLLNI